MDAHSAPEHVELHERRRMRHDQGPVNFSRRPTLAQLRLNISMLDAGRGQNELATEALLDEAGAATPPVAPPMLFHNYLRAFCSFDPPTKVDDTEQALLLATAIRPGDLILVHSAHSNGWADGTVLTTGGRGWFPTNYCESYDHRFMRRLLNAMTQFWDLMAVGDSENLAVLARQDFVRGLVTGVRSLLEHAKCLHRNEIRVLRNTGVRRMRKGLLADLSTLVQLAKRIQHAIGETVDEDAVPALLDDLLCKAFRVVTRAVSFMDMLTQEMNDPTSSQDGTDCESALLPTPLTISKDDHASVAGGDNGGDTPVDSAKYFDGVAARKSLPFKRDSVGGLHKPRSSNLRPWSGALMLRASHAKPVHLQKSLPASEQLSQAHDVCISHVAAFIGLHLSRRLSSDLVATTERLVDGCTILLTLVDAVRAHDPSHGVTILQSRNVFKEHLDELVASTNRVFGFAACEDEVAAAYADLKDHLVDCGTRLIRSVSECVVKSRQLIEQTGDFDLSTPTVVEQPRSEEPQQLAGATEPSTISSSLSCPPSSPPRCTSPEKTRHQRLSISKRARSSSPLQQAIDINDFAFPTPPRRAATEKSSSPRASLRPHKSMPSLQKCVATSTSDEAAATTGAARVHVSPSGSDRTPSVGVSVSESTDTHPNSVRGSETTVASSISTRATTPDHHVAREPHAAREPHVGYKPPSLASFATFLSLGSPPLEDAEAMLQQTSFASELTLNRDGQITGGSLPALVEQLTTHDTAPDPQFVSAFFLTFRMFTTPRDLAGALVARFNYIGDNKSGASVVRLRIYNAFKGWLETYWNAEADREVLGEIRAFAMHKLRPHLGCAGNRLVDLTTRVATAYSEGTITGGPLVSAVGKSSTSLGLPTEMQESAPQPVITRDQLHALRGAERDLVVVDIIDLDALEVARQLTIMGSKLFCDIQPEELLSLEWNNKDTSRAQNIRKMCALNTDLSHLVGDSILAQVEAKKRALLIKHWSKIAMRCQELHNYETLMAIMASLNSSVIRRLQRTWSHVSKKTNGRLAELNALIDHSRNHASLRRTLEAPVVPCLPFLGIFLSDLTFIDAGNPRTRELPGFASSASGEPFSVINFDKHMRMAKIVAQVQKFQVAYRLRAVPEFQACLEKHLNRMRDGAVSIISFHRRSLIIEPKQAEKAESTKKVYESSGRGTNPNGTLMSLASEHSRPDSAGGASADFAPRPEPQPEKHHDFFSVRTAWSFKTRGDASLPAVPQH